jgi:MerR family transcriptional regulator, thiopeptide resistance regulator
LDHRQDQRKNQRQYSTSQFAQKAAVTARTLRFYDKVGLLSPSEYTEAGHRLYSDGDLWSLQQILALKFLGFSLEEIKICLHHDPERLYEALTTQKLMMHEKRHQLDRIIEAIEQAETVLQRDQSAWESIIKVIQVMHMEQKKDWVNTYLTPEQQEKMDALSRKSYSPEAAQKLAEWGQNWTEEDQKRVSQQWDAVFADLRRLVAEKKDPLGPEGQALARRHSDLIEQFTHGDAAVASGLKQWWKGQNELPVEERPQAAYRYSDEEAAFLQAALKHAPT